MNTLEICKLRNYLAAATILTAALAPQNSLARESFYSLRYNEPSIIVNLGALGALNPQTSTPVISMQPVLGTAHSTSVKPSSTRTKIAKKEPAKKAPTEIAKLPEVTPAKTKEAKPVEVSSVSTGGKSDVTEGNTEMVKTGSNPPLLPAATVAPPPPPAPAKTEAVKPVDGNIGGKDKMVALPEKAAAEPETVVAKPATPQTKTERAKKPAKVNMPKVAEFSAGPLPTKLTEPAAVALPPAKTPEVEPTPAKTEATNKTSSPASPTLPPSRDLPPTASPSPAVSSSVLPPVDAVKADSDKAGKDAASDLPPLTSLYENKSATDKSVASKESETASLTMPEKPVAEKPVAEPAAKTLPTKESVIVQAEELPANNVAAENSSDLSIVYGEAEIDLPPSEKAHLEDIVSKLAGDKNSRVTVVAYASGTTDQASQAKRTALARALAVRKYLMDRNISSERMDIRPLGNKAGSGVPDRVDIFIDKVKRS